MTVRFDSCLPAFRPLLERYFAGALSPQTVKENRVRTVQRIAGEGGALYVKRFVETSIGGRLRSLVRDRAAHEAAILDRLRKAGVGAARPVAWGRVDGASFLATEEIPDARPLAEVFDAKRLPELARLVRAVHDAGIRHDDLHIGNVLSGQGALQLIDAHRATAKKLSEAERIHGVAFALHSFYTRVSPGRAHRFLRDYRGRADGAFVRKVWSAFQEVRREYWASRTERCLKESGEFSVDGPWHLRKPFTRAEAERIAAAPGRPVKELPRRRIKVVGDRFVKTGPRSLAEWEHGRALEVRHLPTPTLLAARKGALVGEWRGAALPLWEAIQAEWPRRSRAERNDFLYRLARLVRRLHVRGVFHKDLKANNVLVEGERFWVIDLDRVGLRGEVKESDRLFNLAQLNAAVAAPLTRSERLRAYRYYAGNDRDWRLGWKKRVRRIMETTKARRHHWPPRS